MKLGNVSTALELVGLGLIVLAVAMIAVPLAVAVAGVCLVAIGFNLEPSK
jgi:hypothetical protein